MKAAVFLHLVIQILPIYLFILDIKECSAFMLFYLFCLFVFLFFYNKETNIFFTQNMDWFKQKVPCSKLFNITRSKYQQM